MDILLNFIIFDKGSVSRVYYRLQVIICSFENNNPTKLV